MVNQKIKTLCKKLPLNKIPDNWEIKTIRNTTYLKGRIGWQGLRADEFIEEGPFLVTGTDFENGIIIWDHCYHVSLERFKISPSIHLKNGDLLITKDGTIGKLALVKNCPEHAVLNSGIFLIRPLKSEFCNEYMYYLLNSEIFKKFLKDTQAGSTINHLYQNVFEKFSYPIPKSPHEQSKIAEILFTIDEAIEKADKLVEKYKRIKQGLMQDLFRYGIDENSEIRSEKTQKFKDSELGRIPECWEIRGLLQICSLINGRAFKPSDWSDSGLPIVRIENLNNPEASFNYCNFPVEERYYIDSNDLLISWSGTPGTSFGIFKWERGRAVLNQHIFKTILIEGITYDYFFYAYRNLLEEMIRQSHGGVGLQHITKQDLGQLKMPIPTEPEQSRIVTILSQTDEAIKEEELYKQKLLFLKHGLIYDLLSGKVRVTKLLN